MSRQLMLQECDQQLTDLLPDLPRPEQKALASLVSGVACSQDCRLSKASTAVPGLTKDQSKQRRAQRLLANPRLDVARAQRRLLERVVRGRRGRLDLLLDATTTGATGHKGQRGGPQGGTVTLVLAIGWHRRALPLVWHTWVADQPGQDWRGAIRDLCEGVAQLLPPQVQVVLLVDRGLSGRPLGQLMEQLGWHYLWRVQSNTRVRCDDGTIRLISTLASQPGRECMLSGVRVWAPRHKGERWISEWEHSMLTNVVATWRKADAEAWLLVTDLPARGKRCSEYRHRTWEEELFRDLKSFGWQWQRSRVRKPERVQRLLLVLALATLWVVCLAQRVIRRGQRHLLEERSRRCYSHFQLGLRWVARQLATDSPVHCILHLWPETISPTKLS